jgi:hypothetical protein
MVLLLGALNNRLTFTFRHSFVFLVIAATMKTTASFISIEQLIL